MARASIVTLIPLDRASRIIGIDPYHFNGIYTSRRPIVAAADDVWSQYTWQQIGQASREDLAQALRYAEDETAKYLRYYPVPAWIENEEHQIEKAYATELVSNGLNSYLKRKSIQTDYGYVQDVGKRASVAIQLAAAVVYSDADGDGYNELATVTVATTVTDPEEIHVYFTGYSGEEEWEVRPVDVSIVAGVATITFAAYLVPNPLLWEQDPSPSDPAWRAIDGDNVNNFVRTVDVFRVYIDPSDEATMYWEDCSDCGSCAVCAPSTHAACLYIRDKRLGIVSYSPATWNAATLSYVSATPSSYDADKISINYRAGLVDSRTKTPYLRMAAHWERAIVYYAMTKMDRAWSKYENTHNIWKEQMEDLARVQPDRSFVVSEKDLHNPLGTTKAAINLWRLIEQSRLV